MTPFGIHWFRRDLRIAGNPALEWNRKKTLGRTLGIFFFDSKFLTRSDFSHTRFGFFLQTLKSLQNDLRAAGGDLLVLDQQPGPGFEFLTSKLKAKLPLCISFCRDYEPFARERDHLVTKQLEALGIPVHIERDHLLIEPQELQKEPGKPGFYQVYTPFCRKWFALYEQELIQDRIAEIKKSTLPILEKLRSGKIDPLFSLKWQEVFSKHEIQDSLDEYIQKNAPQLTFALPHAGTQAAYRALLDFQPKVSDYLKQRDFPAESGTSKLSLYFKNGSLTPAIALSLMDYRNLDAKAQTGKNQFLKEIVWREFYYHILYHRPSVEHEAFLTQYRSIKWQNNEKWFEAWKEGRTGFPIVDAGMRELKTTGWMHNRVRMIVASFLTKDLLIDWKWGEKHFMNHLLDGDLAPNNGGWQWAASTGCDPQPYFRIFNPLLQSKKFDPSGQYIRKFVPELRSFTAKDIHEPQQGYIKAIVNHAAQRPKALALYKH